MLGVQLDGAEVDVQIEAEAEAEDDGALHQAGLHIRVTDRTEEHCVEGAPLFDHGVGDQLTGLQVVLGVVRVVYELILEALDFCDCLECLQALECYLGADPVSRNDANIVGLHFTRASVRSRGDQSGF